MKKLLTFLTLILVSSMAYGLGHTSAVSLSGTYATTSSVGSGVSVGTGVGFAVQGSSVSAINATGAGANSANYGPVTGVEGVAVESHVESVGVTTSVSFGIQGGTGSGNTQGLGLQGGIGAADSVGIAVDADADFDHLGLGFGFAGSDAFAAQGSIAATSNVNNGLAIVGSFGVGTSNSDADILVDAEPHDVDFVQSSNQATVAGGGSISGVAGGGAAFGAGGGIADGQAGTFGFGIVLP